MNLNPCKQCGAPAVGQVRGTMGPGDYKEVQKVNHKGHFVADVDFYRDVELTDDNKTDFRVSCTVCDNATGWNKADMPGMPGVGTDFSMRKWNTLNPASG